VVARALAKTPTPRPPALPLDLVLRAPVERQRRRCCFIALHRHCRHSLRAVPPLHHTPYVPSSPTCSCLGSLLRAVRFACVCVSVSSVQSAIARSLACSCSLPAAAVVAVAGWRDHSLSISRLLRFGITCCRSSLQRAALAVCSHRSIACLIDDDTCCHRRLVDSSRALFVVVVAVVVVLFTIITITIALGMVAVVVVEDRAPCLAAL